MKRMMLLFAAAAIAALLCACSAGAQEKVYGKEDTNISVSAGDTFVIKLDENPTTGYKWSFTVSDDSVIELSKDEYMQENQDSGVVGAGGTRVLTFKAKAAGSAQINMVYERSWEKNEDDETLTFSVDVK